MPQSFSSQTRITIQSLNVACSTIPKLNDTEKQRERNQADFLELKKLDTQDSMI